MSEEESGDIPEDQLAGSSLSSHRLQGGEAQVLNESSCKSGVRRGLQNHSLHGPPGPR